MFLGRQAFQLPRRDLLPPLARYAHVDTGAGLKPTNGGLGTGLSTLRERLQLTFGGEAELRVAAQRTSGVSAELDFPAREAGD